ncbi:MAG TPA: hypothetical protein VFT12_00650 [Thermoanaerobaculia bacterium]|nr:hypothetical protein [Thermoanaerobaculia bacterium]
MKLLPLAVLALCITSSGSAAVTGTDGTEMLIPVAGHTPGARGELFVTDLTLVNLSPVDQSVEIVWLPAGGTADPRKETVLIEGYRHSTITDVVNSTFRTEGLGAILVRALNAGAAIDAHARIWTNTTCPGLTGTMSMGVPAVLFDGWRSSSPAYVHGVRYNENIRANYGIVNLDPVPRQFRVIVNSAGGKVEEVVTVPANGTLQKGVPQPVGGDLSVYFLPLGPINRWHAYAASVDNLTGSGWTIPAMQPRVDLVF